MSACCVPLAVQNPMLLPLHKTQKSSTSSQLSSWEHRKCFGIFAWNQHVISAQNIYDTYHIHWYGTDIIQLSGWLASPVIQKTEEICLMQLLCSSSSKHQVFTSWHFEITMHEKCRSKVKQQFPLLSIVHLSYSTAELWSCMFICNISSYRLTCWNVLAVMLYGTVGSCTVGL